MALLDGFATGDWLIYACLAKLSMIWTSHVISGCIFWRI